MLAKTKIIRMKMTLLIVIIIGQVSSVSSWAQLFWQTDRNQVKWKNESNESGVFGERENRCPRRKTSWNKVEKHSNTIYMTSSPKSNLRHIGCHETWNVSPLITMTTWHEEYKRARVMSWASARKCALSLMLIM